MLKVFRQKGVAKKVLWVVAGIIIISFGFGFGISRYGSAFSLSQTAGKVYGSAVSLKEYSRNYQNARDQAVMMHGANVEKILSTMDMDNETWTRIILLKAAEKQHIQTTDMEVVQFVETIPFFQRENEFDKRLYDSMVKNIFRREPRDFEEGLRDQIRIMKLFAPKLKAIAFTDEAVRKEYDRRNRKSQVNYVVIAPEAPAENATTPDKDLLEHFNAHREDFMELETVNVTLVTLPVDTHAAADAKTKVAAAADEAFKKLSAGADPAATAKEYNAAVKETGFFNMNAPNPEVAWSFDLLQQIFTAKPGDTLAPMEAPNGYQIVRIAEKKPAFSPEFTAVKAKVQASFLREANGKIAAEKAAELQKTIAAKVKAGADFTASVKELGLTAKQTPFFGPGDYIPEIGISDDFTTAGLSLTKEAPLSNVVITPRGPAILGWSATQAADDKKFATVKDDFARSLYNEERVRVMNELILSWREKAKLVNYIEKINAQQKNAMEKLKVR